MLINVDEAVVDKGAFLDAKNGDADAIQSLRDYLEGLHLSLHAFPVDESTQKVVSINELHDIGVIKSVKVCVSEAWR